MFRKDDGKISAYIEKRLDKLVLDDIFFVSFQKQVSQLW